MIHKIEVWGYLANFSEMKGERYSYPSPTPSAVRGIFDAIYCKPKKFRWQPIKIEILNPIKYTSLRRNEVGVVAVKNPIDVNKHRQQRQTVALKDVRYRLHAKIVPWDTNDNIKTFDEQFIRRAKSGQCFNHPYFGCREFTAYFKFIEDICNAKKPIEWNEMLPFMLYDVFDLSIQNNSDCNPSISIFNAEIKHGVLDIPEYDSNAVLKGAANYV